MAPVPGITKEETLRRIAQHEVGPCRIDLGSPHRNSVIVYDEIEWRFSTMETDPDEEDALFQKRMAEGGVFLPEDVINLQREALCLIRCVDKRSFMVLVEGLPWEFGGPELRLLAKSYDFSSETADEADEQIETVEYISHADIALHLTPGPIAKIIQRERRRLGDEVQVRITTEQNGKQGQRVFKGETYLSTPIERLQQEKARLIQLRRAVEAAEKELQSVIDARN